MSSSIWVIVASRIICSTGKFERAHKRDSWKLSSDPLFAAKVRDVVRLYLDPPERAALMSGPGLQTKSWQALPTTAAKLTPHGTNSMRPARTRNLAGKNQSTTAVGLDRPLSFRNYLWK